MSNGTQTPEQLARIEQAKEFHRAELTRLDKSSKVGTEDDPFGISGTEATFILDCSGSMVEGMDGTYRGYDNSYFHGSKLGHLHELMNVISREVRVNCIVVGALPDGVVMDKVRVVPDEVNGEPSGYHGAYRTNVIPSKPDGGTPLWAGLQLALNNDWTDVTVLSDGLPQDTERAITVADGFDRIDAWFLGNGNAPGVSEGRNFMKRLHRGAGTFGSTNLGDDAVRRQVANKTVGYLTGYGIGG